MKNEQFWKEYQDTSHLSSRLMEKDGVPLSERLQGVLSLWVPFVGLMLCEIASRLPEPSE